MATLEEVQPYLDDYAAVYGEPTDKFICPITVEPCELNEISKGHIINEKIPYEYNRKVLVKTKPDNFYGTRVEKAFIRFATMSGMSAMDFIRSWPSFKIRFRDGGPQFTAFLIENDEVEEKRKHIPVVPMHNGAEGFFVGIRGAAKDDPEIPIDTTVGRAEISFSDHFMPAHWVASMLKVAHLTMFSMIGYRAVYDPCGDAMRRMIARYFYDNATREAAPDYFRQFENSVKVIGTSMDFKPETYSPYDLDTLRDSTLLTHFHAGRHFAANALLQARGQDDFGDGAAKDDRSGRCRCNATLRPPHGRRPRFEAERVRHPIRRWPVASRAGGQRPLSAALRETDDPEVTRRRLKGVLSDTG